MTTNTRVDVERLIAALIDNAYSDGLLDMPCMSDQTEQAKAALLQQVAEERELRMAVERAMEEAVRLLSECLDYVLIAVREEAAMNEGRKIVFTYDANPQRVDVERLHVRHTGGGRLAWFRGDEEVREIGVTPGWDFKDRDHFIVAVNNESALLLQVAELEKDRDGWKRAYDCDVTRLNAKLAAQQRQLLDMQAELAVSDALITDHRKRYEAAERTLGEAFQMIDELRDYVVNERDAQVLPRKAASYQRELDSIDAFLTNLTNMKKE